MWDFEHAPTPELSRNFEITYTVPSACARALREGEADIGIIPAITLAYIPGLVVIPGIAIAALRPVRSILLISKVPLDRVRTVAADTSSRTSVALTRVVLQKWYGAEPEMVPMAPDLDPMLERCDAALLIGDAALVMGHTEHAVYDLAEIWQQQTGKPFVFAVWAVREQSLAECKPGLDLATVFQHSRDAGTRTEAIAAIAKDWSPRLGLTEESIRSYLTENIHYNLDAACLDGLQAFYRLAHECGVIESAPQLRFLS